ncbi:BREX-1 system phosphatase PglZ type A [Clostridium sp. chh4-2]|uniref:BREX-1 system phosphatase PglZ type A n=1 Tax=Clostridium sp. chh4-2 TaxID=2067550 RepID=UPI000CCE5AA9|nr:BREX-1 system phosphatase PglZ type A [Clostridium sp. chh4-2]PNV62530.1 BREX-1 system phosphatase PglZ type A [Clostridium sp. chh4-2]
MAELNFKQIIDRLNAEFTGETRKLVFWYDDKADFAEDIDTVQLDNAKLLKLKPDNQFQIKYFLERQDTTTNYLIYAPFSKPDVRENHLEDTMLYSKRFYADRASLLSVDLGIEEKYKHVIEKHIKFFANKDRTQRFYDLEIENFNEDNILTGLMSAVCRTKTCSFDEVVRVLLTDDTLEDNKFIAEFDKYELLPVFWKFCEQQFGYADPKPSLEKLVVTMFVTYAEKYIQKEVPKGWRSFISYKAGNIIAFLDSLMNNMLYRERYDELSAHVAAGLNVASALEDYDPETLVECDSFAQIDLMIMKWLIGRLLAEDTGAKLGNHSITEVCEMRLKMHFGERFAASYDLLRSAYSIVITVNYQAPNGFKAMTDRYCSSDCLVDTAYRHFYTSYDKLEDTGAFEQLRDLIENIYTNEYLGKQLPSWNAGIVGEDALSALPLQRDFFSRYVKYNKDRTVVIISDAMRYEVGRELFVKMQDDPKCTAKIESMLSTLPSYTRLGMAALLPHSSLELTDDGKELVDGVYCTDTVSRQTVLQTAVKDSCCVQFDEIKNMKKAGLREIFTGKQVVYIYHDHIDVRGEHMEDEVFAACEEAITEIYDLIHKIATNANSLHFIVTADHGFIYKRDKVTESDKIGGVTDKNSIVKRRYIVSKQPVQDDGIHNLGLGYILGNNDGKIVSFPCSTSVFKTPGSGGQNYVHGGSSPQEMMVPVIDIKMEKGHMETRTVQIMMVSLMQKISNLITTLDFIQSDPVSDVVKGTSFKLYFVSEDNERISNENIYVADKRDADAQKRIFRMRFTFKNKKYDKDKYYYLVAYDESNDLEVFRHAVVMDLAFSDDFGFGI